MSQSGTCEYLTCRFRSQFRLTHTDPNQGSNFCQICRFRFRSPVGQPTFSFRCGGCARDGTEAAGGIAALVAASMHCGCCLRTWKAKRINWRHTWSITRSTISWRRSTWHNTYPSWGCATNSERACLKCVMTNAYGFIRVVIKEASDEKRAVNDTDLDLC